jgi:hypothetical protein
MRRKPRNAASSINTVTAMKLTYLLTSLNQLRIDHWQTKLYAEHKALGTAYEALDALFDTFVETYKGKNSDELTPTVYTVKTNSYNGNLIANYTTMRDSLNEYLGSCTDGSADLENIRADILGEFNHLLYRLQLK